MRRSALAAFGALVIACSGGDRAGEKLALSDCRPKGLGKNAQCGKLRVFEDRARGAGRTIDLNVVVLPALSRDAVADPLFLLAGGPGQAATRAFGPVLPALQRVRKTRDLVLVDVRGTGLSRPLDCDVPGPDAPLARRLQPPTDPAWLKACLAKLDADPRFYTTAAIADDLDDVRAALGYARVNLLGGSYGTRLALVYARRHAERVRAMVLDGVAPISLRLPLSFARDGQRALDLTLDQCAADAACNARFPALRQRFEALLAKLDTEPAKLRVSDPLTGAPADVVITRRVFVDQLRGLLYAPELLVLLPLTLEHATARDFAPFVAQADLLNSRLKDSMSAGLMLSVICAEDAPAIGADEVARFSQGTFLGPQITEQFLEACKLWPHGEAPPGWREPIKSDAPALLLSGELDPVTPPRWAEEALRTLPNGAHLVVAGVGHGVTTIGCVPELIAKFLAAGSARGLDLGCAKAVKRPAFFLSFAGPPP